MPSRARAAIGHSVLVTPLRRRTFRLLFVGQVVSQTGDIAFQVALAAYAVQHHSPRLLAYTLLAQGIGTVAMLLISGALTDRLGARRILLGADMARLVAVVMATTFVADGVGGEWQLVACGLLLGSGDGAFQPAFTVVFTELLPANELLAANSVQTVALRLSAVVGAALGAVFVASAPNAAAFGYDAATFAASLICLIAAGRWAAAREPAARFLTGVTAGIRYVAAHPWLWVSIASFGISVALVIAPSKVLVPLIVHDQLHAGGSTYGLILAAQGIGALIGGLIIGRHRQAARPGALIFTLMIGANGGYAVIAISHLLVVSIMAAAVAGAAICAATVAWAALLQHRVPLTLLGRVSSVDWLVSLGAAPLALAAVPHLLTWQSGAALLLIVSGVGVATNIAALFVRDIRALRWRAAPDHPQEFADG